MSGNSESIKELVDNGHPIVDVRTPAEYQAGHVSGSVNIPLDTVKRNLNKLKKMQQPIIMCCKSGARSGMAVGIVRQAGIEAVNAGSWKNISL